MIIIKRFQNIQKYWVHHKIKLIFQPVTNCRPCSYKAAVKVLNNLQNIPTINKNNILKLLDVQKYLYRLGISFDQLDTLSTIHITGTKGKGSTCAFCESILRHHGFSTGFFSSPHLFEVRERIRINGRPISRDCFSSYFWKIYYKLYDKMENPLDMPSYFKFLTILAFQVFLDKKLDVAIIEVGIGGEYDSTNVLRKVPVVGISSLGVDHMSILGNTIEEIAWHKAGIMKPNCQAITVPQSEKVMRILQKRSLEINCSLKVINDDMIRNTKDIMNTSLDAISMNAALSVALSEAWVRAHGFIDISTMSGKTILGLRNCVWPGRFQVIHQEHNTFYIDGAHTIESLKFCSMWFLHETQTSLNEKILIFNTTGDRDSINLLKHLYECNFNKVFFVPNISNNDDEPDNINLKSSREEQMLRCQKHKNIWKEFNKKRYGKSKDDNINICLSISDALSHLNKGSVNDVLVTGSVHLVGSFLFLVNPNVFGKNN